MRLPLTVNDMAEVFDADGRRIADFWTPDVTRSQAQANAEQYVNLMNRLYSTEAA